MALIDRKNSLLFILIALTLVNLVILVIMLTKQPGATFKPFPQDPKSRDSCRMQDAPPWHSEIGFTVEQQEKLKTLRAEFRQQFDSLINESNKRQEEIFTELEKPFPDSMMLEQLIAETGKLHMQMRRASVDHILKLKQITTPEQQQKMLLHMRKGPPQHMGPRPPDKSRKPRKPHGGSGNKAPFWY